MFKILLGAFIGSLVVYNVILPDDSFRSTFEDVNEWTLNKIEAVTSDVNLDSAKDAILKQEFYLHITEISAGQSYACRFRLQTVLDEKGYPANPTSPPVRFGTFESLGIIVKRDTEAELVELLDQHSKEKYIVPFSDIWDVDTIDWVSK